jgi:CheY-like chemotaxis protein
LFTSPLNLLPASFRTDFHPHYVNEVYVFASCSRRRFPYPVNFNEHYRLAYFWLTETECSADKFTKTGSVMKIRKILIVEDVDLIADFMKLVLDRHGFQVSGLTASGEEAVALALAASPDLVLMDIRLNGFIDGIEAAERIRSHRNIPIVFVSAYTDIDIIQRAMAVGASGYIIKPFKGKDLIFAVERALGGQDSGMRPGEAFTVNFPPITSRP